MKRSFNFSGQRKYLATYLAELRHRTHTYALTCAKCHQRFELQAEDRTSLRRMAWDAGWRLAGDELYCPSCASEAAK